MEDATEDRQDDLTRSVIDKLKGTTDPRLRHILERLVTHLHDFVREVELTEEEWMAGIRFLTDTGHMCDGAVRQEFILLSDTLGVSMLVDAINHRHASATASTVLGPFYITGQPDRALGEDMAVDGRMGGEPALVHGYLRRADGSPIAGALLDVWQTAPNGMYSGQDPAQPLANLRGRYRTEADGYFALRTVAPVSYPIPTDGPVGRMLIATGRHPNRPAHVHFMISAPGCRTLVTHLFRRGDTWLDSDAVFGVKDSLVVDFVPRPAGDEAGRRIGLDQPFLEARYDFVLADA